LGKTVIQPLGFIDIFIGKDSYTAFRVYRYFHWERQLYRL